MEEIEHPAGLSDALERPDELGRHTIAAWLVSRAAYLFTPEEERDRVFESQDMEVLGFRTPESPPEMAEQSVGFHDLPGPGDGQLADLARDPGRFFALLADLIWSAEGMPAADAVQPIAIALRIALAAPDPMLRVTALCSGIRIFRPEELRPLARLETLLVEFPERPAIVDDLVAVLANRLLPAQASVAAPPPAATAGPGAGAGPGLIFVHGTNPWGNPDWYMPPSGELYAYLKPFRADIFSGSDPYEWEGKWSHRARRVAAQHLKNWQTLHGLKGCDAIVHSHGGNVVMKAGDYGASFNKVVFCSVPVHWATYNLNRSHVGAAFAVRIHFDWVILADRGAQAFPPGVLQDDVVLPWYFGRHSASRKKATWSAQNLETRF